MSRKFYVLILLFLAKTIFAQSQEKETLPGLIPEFSYTGEIANNLSGGIKTGTEYLGMVNFKLTANLWKKGTLFINLANTHGAEPSSNLFGDHQIASNIEAGDHTYLQEFWLKQNLKILELKIGLQDLNVDFVNSSHSSLFLNSSFGIMPTVSVNIPAPIFPLTSLGLSSKWLISEKVNLLFAVFDGVPTDFKDNPYNIKWHLKRNDGFLFFTEIQKHMDIQNKEGILKIGTYIHQHFNPVNEDSGAINDNNNGFYLISEQKIWEQENKSIGAFIQLGFSPKKINTDRYFLGCGLNLYGLNKKRNDIFGIAVAHDGIYTPRQSETSVEITYQTPLLSFFTIQPDIQYIINPSGTKENLKNCLAFFLRFYITLKPK